MNKFQRANVHYGDFSYQCCIAYLKSAKTVDQSEEQKTPQTALCKTALCQAKKEIQMCSECYWYSQGKTRWD